MNDLGDTYSYPTSMYSGTEHVNAKHNSRSISFLRETKSSGRMNRIVILSCTRQT